MTFYESKACSRPDLFAFQERTKDIVDHGAGRAAAGVAHAEHDVWTKFRPECHGGVVLIDVEIARPNEERATLGHGFAGIEEEGW